MSLQSIVRTVFTARLLQNLNNAHNYANCANRDYQGVISRLGASVTINSIGRVTINDYIRNTDINPPEEVDLASQTLVIDQAKYYSFAVDSIDELQAESDVMDAAIAEAAWGLANEVDLFLGQKLAAEAGNTLAPATVGTGPGEVSLYDILVEMAVKLDENNTPNVNRWVVIPAWAHGMALLDERFVSFGTSESNARLRGRPISEAAGFAIYKSNNVPRDGSEYIFLAGYQGAFSYAEQLARMETFQPERRFGDAVKGILVFGAQVTRPSNIVRFDATMGTFR